jgi:disulfide bond formation protein DsbB
MFKMTSNRLTSVFPLALIAVSVGALGTAFTIEHMFGVEPCTLCLYQRIPYAAVGVLGLIGLFLNSPGSPKVIVAIATATFCIEAAIAFYHVGVEQNWWASAAACGGGVTEQISIYQFQTLLQQKPAKACDEVDWTLFGISMATYNVSGAFGLAAASAYVWRQLRKAA